VDPYYLTHKAQQLGYYPEVILSGRRINENMGAHVAKKVVKMLIQNGHKIKGASILILGITFKENCPDIRNSGVIDVINEFEEFGTSVDIYDPWVIKDEVKKEYGVSMIDTVKENYAAIVHAVSHDQFKELDLKSMLSDSGIIYDVKSSLPKELINERL